MPISQSGWRSSQLAKNIAIALCALLPAAGAHAADAGDPMFSFSGFGTFGVVHSSEHQADYISNIFEPNGAGFTHSWSANIDSRIGAQLNANFTPQLSAVVQVISEQNYDKSYRPHIEWANIKYQFTPDFSVRAGRIVLTIQAQGRWSGRFLRHSSDIFRAPSGYLSEPPSADLSTIR